MDDARPLASVFDVDGNDGGLTPSPWRSAGCSSPPLWQQLPQTRRISDLRPAGPLDMRSWQRTDEAQYCASSGTPVINSAVQPTHLEERPPNFRSTAVRR